jgi:hypothetical protein
MIPELADGAGYGIHSGPGGADLRPLPFPQSLRSRAEPVGAALDVGGSGASRAGPGGDKMREYETTIIVQPEISEEGTAATF